MGQHVKRTASFAHCSLRASLAHCARAHGCPNAPIYLHRYLRSHEAFREAILLREGQFLELCGIGQSPECAARLSAINKLYALPHFGTN
jgi:hypothetical protein